MDKYLKISSVILMVLVCYLLSNCDETSREFCFVVDSKCPTTYLDIDITPVHRSIPYDPPKHPINVHGPLENINKGLRISGYEINFGFWSKDSYRSYSAYDYLREKLGREPTQAEINRVTEQEIRDWFNNKHKVNRPWYLGGGTDWPRDVEVYEDIERKGPCMTLSAEYFYTIKGIITFADGTKCFVAPEKGLRDLFSGTIVNGSTTIVLKPDKNCNACNNLNK